MLLQPPDKLESCLEVRALRFIMLRWLKNKGRSTPAVVYSGAYSVTSSDYRYGFHSSIIKNPERSEGCFPETAPHDKLTLPHASTEHIYEDIDDGISQAEPYSITSLDDLIDQNPLNKVYFKKSLANNLSSDNGLDNRQSSEDAESTISASYQSISGPSTEYVSTSSSCYQPINTLAHSTQQTLTRQKKKKLIKIKSKASSIFRVRKCKRWISNHFNATKPRSESSDEDYPQVHVIRPRFESTRQFTRRRLALKKIEDHWFDSDEDSSVLSEDSFYSRMDISDLCQDPIIPAQSEASTQCDIESDSGLSSLPESSSPSENSNHESSKEDPIVSEEEENEEELPLFKPRTGFGLNRWYRP
ncbi:hypothetical protein LOTGIDRAFT_153527 [Lottia gigantea]|uniref:Uncharacterized protein n=1 Tax=Lottia gigantea TaxID=225164 RepID=V4BY60_LOTGI|nr:hypothetical protein LOTGIDRAFT_153527 [Lottia gigantea]ESO94044.1 hypothetical protein LOTGIDRAFT_153527 [Lottia gigantea]